jgi:hypothetical protein
VVSGYSVAAGDLQGHTFERRDLTKRSLCDAVAQWFQLHPSALAPLDGHTVTRMATRVGVAPAAGRRSGVLPRVLEIGGFRMNRARRTVHVDGVAVSLTPTEFDLLLLLVSRIHSVQSSADLTRRLWGSDADRHRQSLFVYIRRLRAKLDRFDGLPFRITTVFGRGYRIDLTGGDPTPRDREGGTA